MIGSNGIAILMAFFDTQPELRDSDEERVEFAKYYLENLRFLYKDSENENKKVHVLNNIRTNIWSNNMIFIRNGRGSFAAPLSSRLSQLILLPSRVQSRLLASTTINQLLRWLAGWPWLLLQ